MSRQKSSGNGIVEKIRAALGGGSSDPLFAMRIVQPDGKETQMLSTNMDGTVHGESIFYSCENCPVQVSLRFDQPRLHVTVKNSGKEKLGIDFYAPVATRLTDRKTKACIAQVGGVVIPVKDCNYLHHNSGQLAALFMLLQRDGEGLALSHEKTAEDEGRYRSGIAVHSEGLPIGPISARISDKVGSAIEQRMGTLTPGDPACELGGVACFSENLVLSGGAALDLGPYLLLPYKGQWTQGAALLRKHRYQRRFRPRPNWFKPVHNCAEICCHPPFTFDTLMATRREQRNWGSPLFSLNFFFETHSNMTWGSSFKHTGGAKHLGGDDALRKAIDDLHKEGSKVLFYVTPWSLTLPYEQAQVCLEHKWNLQEHPGKDASPLLDYGEFGKFVCPCPAHAPARKWVVEGIAQTLKDYPIDGFFFDEAAAIINRPCHNPAHRHDQPYVWTYGNYLVFRDLRRAMDKINPDSIILSEGGSELYREFIDGCLGHTSGFSSCRYEVPFTRAVAPDVCIFDSAYGMSPMHIADAIREGDHTILESEQVINIHFAGGVPYYLNGAGAGKLAKIWPRHEIYRRAYPEMFSGDIQAEMPVFSPGSTVGYLIRSGDTLIMTAAQLGGEDWGNGRPVTATLPVPAKSLYDRVEYRYHEIRDGQVTFRLRTNDVTAFEVLM
jgi:hypothetical protein